MKSKFILYTLFSLVFFSACKDKNTFVLEGNIDGINNPAIYFLTSYNNGTAVDTVFSQNGKFRYESSSDSIKPVLIYLEDGSIWITVWAKNGQSIKISGDINYPELIQAGGNSINEKLSLFKQNNKEAIQEKSDLADKLDNSDPENEATFEDDYSRKITLEQTLRRNAENFIKENPASIASLVLIQDYILESGDPVALEEYLSLIEGPATEDRLYGRLNNACQRLFQTSIGSVAPDFSIMDIRDSIISLDMFHGKYLILSFEKSGCGPCSEDYPALKEIYKYFNRKDLEILTIAFEDDKSNWLTVAEEYNINWLQSVDTYEFASPLLSLYNVNALPDYFLLDREGKILASHSSIKHIEDLLNEHLKKNKS